MIFVLVYFRALERKPVICKSDVLFSLFSLSLFSSIPTEKSQKIFLLPWKIFYKRKLFMHLLELRQNFIAGTKTGNPERAISAHLTCSGSQSEHRIRLIFPACGACHIIKINNMIISTHIDAVYLIQNVNQNN